MSLFTFFSFVYGVLFLRLGAWPVFGFLVLDILLVYVAFRLNFRAGQQQENIRLAEDMFTITRISPNGASVVEEFQAYWARVRIAGGHLWVTSRGESSEIGNFLGEDEKEEVCNVLTAALATYRSGGIIQPSRPSTSIMS